MFRYLYQYFTRSKSAYLQNFSKLQGQTLVRTFEVVAGDIVGGIECPDNCYSYSIYVFGDGGDERLIIRINDIATLVPLSGDTPLAKASGPGIEVPGFPYLQKTDNFVLDNQLGAETKNVSFLFNVIEEMNT